MISDPKVLVETYLEKYSAQELVVLAEGTKSLLAILSVPKHKMMQASSKESLTKKKKFHANANVL